MVTEHDTDGTFGEEVKLSNSAIQAQFGFLQGKVLTIIEASLEGQKLIAVKGLIKKMFAEQQTWVRELCFPNCRMMTKDEALAKIEDLEELEKHAPLASFRE